MKAALARQLWRLRAIAHLVLSTLIAPSSIVVLLFLAAGALCVAGVLIMFGTGWALLAAAVNLYALALGLAKVVYRG